MSTLTSSQLNIKRSSTRLHAPPGGFSSFSFGSSEFRTTGQDPPPGTATRGKEDDNPATCNTVKYDHPTNNQSADGGYAPTFHSMKAQPSYSNHQQYHSTGPYGPGYQQQPQQTQPSAFNTNGMTSRPPPTSNNYSWNDAGGAQPPLTSSKRDQNWEKKRRLWLARKNAGGQLTGAGLNHNFMPPPATMSLMGSSYKDSMMGGTYNSPSSPLTKFVAQQNLKQHVPQGYDHTPPGTGSGMYDRPLSSTPPSSCVPPRTAFAGCDVYSSHGRGYSSNGPPSSTPPTSGVPPRTALAGSDVYSGHGRGYSSNGPPPGSGSSTSSSHLPRQPPGGQSQWSPYS